MIQPSVWSGRNRQQAVKCCTARSSEAGSRYLSQSRRHTWPSP